MRGRRQSLWPDEEPEGEFAALFDREIGASKARERIADQHGFIDYPPLGQRNGDGYYAGVVFTGPLVPLRGDPLDALLARDPQEHARVAVLVAERDAMCVRETGRPYGMVMVPRIEPDPDDTVTDWLPPGRTFQ
jgi:hypothetical protein